MIEVIVKIAATGVLLLVVGCLLVLIVNVIEPDPPEWVMKSVLGMVAVGVAITFFSTLVAALMAIWSAV